MAFTDTLNRWVEGITDGLTRNKIRRIAEPVYDRMSSVALTSAGLVIKAGGSTLAKTGGSVTYLLVNGILVKIAAATDMAALAGTVTAATWNVYCFFIDQGGTVTSAMGVGGASIGALKFPQFPKQKTLIGCILINPTGTGDFVGGTTALDDATVVPNAVYINGTEGFDPYVLIG